MLSLRVAMDGALRSLCSFAMAAWVYGWHAEAKSLRAQPELSVYCNFHLVIN